MPIVTWTRINPTTERHMPTGVEVVKVPARTGENTTSRLQWHVRYPAYEGMGTLRTRTSRNDAKLHAERDIIPGVTEYRERLHAEAIEMEGRRREAPAAEHFRQAVIATIPTDGLGMDILHTEALAEDAEREHAAEPTLDLATEDGTDYDARRLAAACQRVSLRVQSSAHARQVAIMFPAVLAPQFHPHG